MARKDLSRTVIEGGRYYHNCWYRRASHAAERATTRAWLDRVADDLDVAEASAPPARRRVRRSFYDKLGPAQRWLAAQAGRPWSKVYAELCARFDTRTVAGRHVVHDHLLRWVRHHHEPERHSSRADLVIDAHGILRKPRWFGYGYGKLLAMARAWANGRFCALTHRGWWWFHAEGTGGACAQPYACPRPHEKLGDTAFHAVQLTGLRPLTPRQVRYLEQLPEDVRRRIVVPDPWARR